MVKIFVGGVSKTLAKTMNIKEDFGPPQLKKNQGVGGDERTTVENSHPSENNKSTQKKNRHVRHWYLFFYSVQGNASSSVKSALSVGALQARARQNKLSKRHKQSQGVGTPASHFAPPTLGHLPCSGST